MAYSLFPRPITGHEMLKPMVSFHVIFLNRRVVKFIVEVRICKKILNKFAGIPKPDLMLSPHPRRYFTLGQVAIVLKSGALPIDVAQCRRVNCVIHVTMRIERCAVLMRGKRSSPEAEKDINVAP